MGFTPAEVQGMSLWEFQACSDGFHLMHGGKPAAGDADLSESDLAAMGIEGF